MKGQKKRENVSNINCRSSKIEIPFIFVSCANHLLLIAIIIVFRYCYLIFGS